MLGKPPYVWIFPCMFESPVCLDASICWMPPVCLDAPMYVLVPSMFGCPLYLCIIPYVCMQCMFGCPLYIKQHNEIMLCQNKQVFACPHTFVCHPVCWTPPYIQMPQMYGGIQTCWGLKTYGGIQTYRRGHPNIWGIPNIQMGVQT